MSISPQPKDLEDFGMDKVIEMALEAAWDGCDAVYMSVRFCVGVPRHISVAMHAIPMTMRCSAAAAAAAATARSFAQKWFDRSIDGLMGRSSIIDPSILTR